MSKHNFQELIAQYTFIETNSSRQIAPILYPWGLPLLLHPVYQIWGLDIFKMKLTVYGFYVLSLLVLYALFRRRLPQPFNLLLVAVFAFNPYFFSFRDNVVSDLPHLFFMLFSLLVVDRTLLRHRPIINPAVDAILLGALLYAACLIRVSGMLLVLVLPVYQYAGNRTELTSDRPSGRQWGLFLLPYGVFAGLTLLTNLLLPNGSSNYFSVAERVIRNPMMLLDNLMYYLQLPSEFFYTKPFAEHVTEYVPLPFDLFYNFTYTISLAQVLFGLTLPFLVKGIRKRIQTEYPYVAYASLLVASLIFYEKGGLRFLFPILPFYVYFTLVGLQTTSVRIRQIRIPLATCFCVVLLSDFLFQTGLLTHHFRKETNVVDGPYSVHGQSLFRYIDQHTQPGDVFIFRKPTVLLFYANRLGFMINSLPELKTARPKATHIIIDRKNLKDQVPPDSLQQGENTELFKPVFKNGQFTVYKIQKSRGRGGV